MTDTNDRQHGENDARQPSPPSKIQHKSPGISGGESGVFRASISGSPAASSLPAIDDQSGGEANDHPDAAVPVADGGAFEAMRPKIVALGTDRKHEEEWRRTPNTTGEGAIHVRTFHTKLTDDALNYMDRTINEWLDAHPQYEVKFVNSTIGILTGKLKEPHLIVQVWV